MIYSYIECLEKYHSDYQIKKAIEKRKLFKYAEGIYSDREYVPELAVICKKYPAAVFTLQSAFYYQNLTDTIPQYYYLLTDKDAAKIKDKKVVQMFDNHHSLNMGIERKLYNGTEISVFSKERLLVELIRYKYKLAYDYYKEIIGSYRKILYELEFSIVEEYAEKLPKSNMVMNTIQAEVF